MKKILKFLLLPVQEKKLLCQSLSLVLAIRVGLWFFPFKRLNRWLCAHADEQSGNEQVDWNVVRSVARAVQTCSRFIPQATCLTQALATRTLLRLRGQDSHLKIGVDRDENDKFMAHAWIEVDGKIVIGKLPRHQRFSVLNSSSVSI